MKGHDIKDERIIGELNRFSSHGFMIVFGLIMVSLLVKVFVLQWDMKYWLDTFLIGMAACLYVTVRSIKSGLYLLSANAGSEKRFKIVNLISGALAALIWAGLMFIDDLRGSQEVNMAKSITSTLVGAVIFFIGITWLQWVMIKRSNKNADKMLE